MLSREAGAASLIGDSELLVNPYNVSATAEALHAGLCMAPANGTAERRVTAAPPPRRRSGGWRTSSPH